MKETVKFIKELSANIPCLNSTLELSSSFHLCCLYSSVVLLKCFQDEQLSGKGIACVVCPGHQHHGSQQSQFRSQFWLSLTCPYLTSSSSHSSSWAQSVTAFLWENSIGYGLHQRKTRMFFLYSPSMKTVPSGPGFEHDHSKYTHMLRNGWTQYWFYPQLLIFHHSLLLKKIRRFGCLLTHLWTSALIPLYLPLIIRVVEVLQININSLHMELSPMHSSPCDRSKRTEMSLRAVHI